MVQAQMGEGHAHLEQLRHNLGMLCCEAHVHAGGKLQGIQMPATLRHEVIDLVDIQLLGSGLDGDHTHVWLSYHFLPVNLLHALSKFMGSLQCTHKGSVQSQICSDAFSHLRYGLLCISPFAYT